MSLRTCPHCDSPIALHLTRCNYCNGRLEAPEPETFQAAPPPPPPPNGTFSQSQAQQGQYQQPPQGQYGAQGQYQQPPQGQYGAQGQYQQQPQGNYGAQGPYQQQPQGQYSQGFNQGPQHQVPPYQQGYGQPYGQPYVRPYYRNPKSKIAAGLLGIFLGGFGIHKFYLGRIGWGIVYLLFCWTYIPGIIGFIEGIVYLASNEDNFHRKYSR